MYRICCFIFLFNIPGVSKLLAQQHVEGSKKENTKGLAFIDGIELNRNEIHSSSNSIKRNSNSIKILPNEYLDVSNNEMEELSSLQFKYAQVLNVEVESLTNKSLYEFVEDWLGTRYQFGGSSKSGIDCSSFSGLLQKNIYGLDLPRNARQQFESCEKISSEEMKEGDLVFFNTRGGVSHVGVYLGNNYFVHASTSLGVIISNLDESYYKNRFVGAGRIAKSAGF